MTLVWRIKFLAVCLFIGASAQAKPITLAYNTNALYVTLPILVGQELFDTIPPFPIPTAFLCSARYDLSNRRARRV